MFLYQSRTIQKRYISGMVTTHRVCEIIAMDAPGLVSPPYAAGKTTVFNVITGVYEATNGKIDFKDMPLIVGVDCNGNSVFSRA